MVAPKTVLVTGVGGFVGSHVLRHLLENTDWHIIGLDSFRHHGKLDRVAYQLDGQDRSRYTHLVYDLTIPFSNQFAAKLDAVDYVLAIASESHVERSITDPRPFVENNVSLMLTLLEWAREHPVEKFQLISTDEVFGPIASGGHKEGTPYKPSNPYSASKAMQESLAFSYWRTYGVPVVVTNTMNLLGSMQDPEKYVPKIMQTVQRGDTLTVHASSDGRIGTRFYMHARNQADALLFLLQNHTPARYPESDDLDRFNVVSDNELDNLELAQLVAGYMGHELKYELVDFHATRPGHDLRYGLDGSKIASIGWKPPFEFYESLQKTVEWTARHPEWLDD